MALGEGMAMTADTPQIKLDVEVLLKELEELRAFVEQGVLKRLVYVSRPILNDPKTDKENEPRPPMSELDVQIIHARTLVQDIHRNLDSILEHLEI